jgi:hypothetical protein
MSNLKYMNFFIILKFGCLFEKVMSLKKNILEVIVKNNGFEIKNIYNLFLSDIDNKYTLEAKNLANMLNGKLEINAIENEGMQYSLTIKIK